jgi:hypothetical protein
MDRPNPASWIEFDPVPDAPLTEDQTFAVYHGLREAGDIDALTLFLKDRPGFDLDAYHAWVSKWIADSVSHSETNEIENVQTTPNIRNDYDPGFDGVNPYLLREDALDGQGREIGKGYRRKAHAEGYFNQDKQPGGKDHDGFSAVKPGQKVWDGTEKKKG